MPAKLYTVGEASQIISKQEGRPISVHVLYYRANKRGLGRKYSPTELLFDEAELVLLAEKRFDMDKEERMERMRKGRETQTRLREEGKIEPRSIEYLEVKKSIVELFHKKWTPVQLQKMRDDFLAVYQAWLKKSKDS
jgi:hypothetical protein